MAWRRRWAANWESVRYCSDACRRGPRGASRDAASQLREAIEALLDARPRGASICPSEAARVVDPDGWRDLMTATRDVGRLLAAEGRLLVTQGGATVEAATARGPIRYRRPDSWPAATAAAPSPRPRSAR